MMFALAHAFGATGRAPALAWASGYTLFDDFARPDGALGTARSGHVWSLVPTNGAARQTPVISNQTLICPDRPPATGAGSTASYWLADVGVTATKVRAWISFSPGANNSSATLILTSTNDTSTIDYIVVAGSVHVVFSNHQATMGFYVGNVLTNLTTFNYADMLKDGTVYEVGFDLAGDTMTLYGPNGETTTRTDSRFVTYAGRYVTYEHFWATSPADCKPIFHRVAAK